MTDFSLREIVSELDRFIVGQSDAKRAVAMVRCKGCCVRARSSVG